MFRCRPYEKLHVPVVYAAVCAICNAWLPLEILMNVLILDAFYFQDQQGAQDS